ncbi:5'-3' exonuclease [Romboutsia sp.]|uniref:5'-3' exonuclease n=1 Tax=Romboutsia sp. TaxID=1965302 RepID=UPI003F2B3941
MDNLFDFLENQIKQESQSNEDINNKKQESSDYIRLNSYVGSRMNTDFRQKDNINKEKIEEKINIKEDCSNSETLNLVNIDKEIEEDKFLIVDGSSLLSTSFYATARDLLFAKTEEQKEIAYTKLMQTSDGVYTNGVYMFFRTLLPLLEKYQITHLAIVLDRSRDTFRRQIDPEYKATRSETPKPLKEQFKLLTEILSDINIKIFSHADYEADDFAGSLAKKFEKEIPIILHTKDEDYLQLVSDYTKLWMVTGKADAMYEELSINKSTLNLPSGVFEYEPKYVKHFKGVDPIQIIDIKAIEGDKSDNIKGVKGVGPTSSRPLVAHYGSLEGIYENLANLDSKGEKELATFFKDELGIKRSPIKNLLTYKEEAIISKKLATIKTDIEEIQNLEVDNFILNIDKDKMEEIFVKLGMKSLIKK